MTYEEREERRKRANRLCILAHSIAEHAVAGEDVTFSEAIQILDKAKNIVEMNMKKQRASIQPEIRDDWGVVIGISGT